MLNEVNKNNKVDIPIKLPEAIKEKLKKLAAGENLEYSAYVRKELKRIIKALEKGRYKIVKEFDYPENTIMVRLGVRIEETILERFKFFHQSDPSKKFSDYMRRIFLTLISEKK
jgi:hypothetical protein